MEAGWVAVAPLGARALAVHVLREADHPPRVQWATRCDWDDPLDALVGLRRTRHLAQHRAVALLQRAQYHLLPTDAPELERAQWRDALRWQLREQVDFPVEDAALDLLEIPAELSQRGRTSLLAVVAPHGEMQALAHAAEDAGAPWQAIDIPETALRNIAVLHEHDGQGVALLHVGERECALVITAQGELLQSRAIEATRRHLIDDNEFYRQSAFERIGLELQRSLDGFERQFGRVSIARLLVAGASLDPFIAYLRELLYLPVQPLQLADVLDLSAVPDLHAPEEQAAFLTAIGAALRTD